MLNKLLNELRGCADEENRIWYSWLFEGTCADIDIPLWESAYAGEKDVLINSTTLDVLKCYFDEHLAPRDKSMPADYIGNEIEFYLILQSRGRRKEAEDFYNMHLKPLAENVFGRVLKYSGSAHYTDLAGRALELFEEDKAPAGEMPEKSAFEEVSDEYINEQLQVKNYYISGLSNCGGKCQLEADVAAGCVLDIHEARRPDPLTIQPCARGRHYRSTYLNTGRIRYPMIRVGERGEGRFKRISWQEALELMRDKLTALTAKYGPGCRFVPYATGVTSEISGASVMRRMLVLNGGCLTHFNSYSSACITYTLPYIYGTTLTGSSLASFDDTNLMIFWGNNPIVTEYCDEVIRLIRVLREKGTRVIVIDPHYNETAKALKAEWIPIRPDTDAALAAAMAYVLWDENLCDQAFMDRCCLGFDKDHMPEGMEDEESYHDYVFGTRDRIAKTPEWAAGITGIPAERIRTLAREFALAQPAAIMAGRGCQRVASGEQNIRSIAMLPCMMGYVGVKGGGTGYNCFAPRHAAPAISAAQNPYKGKIPSFMWTDAILDGHNMTREKDHIMGLEKLDSDIKIIFNIGGNCLINQHSDINRTARILKDETKCEFIVVSDIFMTSSARFADLLLPSAGMFETSYICRPWGEGNYLLYSQQAIQPLFECRSDAEWILELEKMLGGSGTSEGASGIEDWYRLIYERARKTEPELPDYETFKKNGGYRYQNNKVHTAFEQEARDPAAHPFPTDSGLIEIFSGKLKAWNDPDIPAIPKYIGGFEGVSDPRMEQFPLQLIGWHTKRRAHSVGDNDSKLESVEPHRLWINPADAAERGIEDGDMVRVFNDRGVVKITAHVTADIMQGVICIPQGAWYTPDEDSVDVRGCINTLTTPQPTALAKANPQHSCLAEVELE
ncbi:MAG: molybdopterin-dependent oxidoreductase [Lachnospiraceae bacterium]|nr:molybdopterin-dependent oxidoreductase [Lachnospiraceae bacterium]